MSAATQGIIDLVVGDSVVSSDLVGKLVDDSVYNFVANLVVWLGW